MTLKARPSRAPGDSERQLADHRRAIDEVQRDPFVNGRDLDVTLPANTATQVKHGLGHAMTNYTHSAPRGGAGTATSIVETARDSESVTLKSVTAGGSVTVTVRFW